jgi:hypothetical protein
MSLDDARLASDYELRAYLVDSELVVIRPHGVVDVALGRRGVRHRAEYSWLLTERRSMGDGLGL